MAKGKSIIKRLTLYSSLLTVLFCLNSSNINKKSKDYFRRTTKISKHKIEYNSGTIYIGNKSYLSKINNLGSNDVLVLDERMAADPNLRILDSYEIINGDIREEIIESLLYYEEVYPTDWNRTKNSLLREWFIHNIMYRLGYRIENTIHVDLNNGDEKTYCIRK